MSSFLGIVGGGVITIITAITVEYLRMPKLVLDIEDPLDKPPKRHLRLLLRNKPLPRVFQWILQRSAALQCRGEITFLNLDGQNIFGETIMNVRWAKSQEPGQITGQVFNLQQPAMLQYNIVDYTGIASTMDVYPGEKEPEILDVAVRFAGEPDCYGWNNESYFNNWRTPHWRLPRGTYLVRVVITSSGRKCVGRFRLLNEVDPLTGFRLTPLLKEDEGKIG